MAVKKDLPTMVEGVTGSTSAGKTNTNTSGNKTTTTTTSNSTPSATPDKMPSVPNTTGTSTTTTASVNTTPVTSLTSKDEDYYDNLYVKGGWTQDQQEAISHGGTGEVGKTNSQGDWYLYDSAARNDYADDADATFMNGSDYYMTTQNKNAWHALNEQKKIAKQNGDTALVAQIQAQQDALHKANEDIRAGYGYTGGVDGSMFEQIDRGDSYTSGYTPNHTGGNSSGYTGGYTGGVTSTPSVTVPSKVQTQSQNELKEMLEAWKEAAEKQSNGQIDYAVEKAVTDLERALADAQPQFKEQAESVDRDARQAMDNSALYAELRGDKGGIGQEQYNSIQNTQAQNHLTVQQAQTKLATDTQRQIADLRAQGEFEKADAALQITQQYLQQLISLEQWAAQYNLSVEQFNAQLQQWEKEYQLALQQFAVDTDLAYGQLTGMVPSTGQITLANQQFQSGLQQWQQEFDFAQQQYQNSLDQWEREFAAEQLLAQLKSSGSGTSKSMTLSNAKSLASDGVFTAESLAAFYANGYTDDDLKRLYRYSPTNGVSSTGSAGSSNTSTNAAVEALWDRGSNAPTTNVGTTQTTKPHYQSASKLGLNVSNDNLASVISMLSKYGAVVEGDDGYLHWANGWNAGNYNQRLSMIAGEQMWDRHS